MAMLSRCGCVESKAVVIYRGAAKTFDIYSCEKERRSIEEGGISTFLVGPKIRVQKLGKPVHRPMANERGKLEKQTLHEHVAARKAFGGDSPFGVPVG